MNLELLGPIGLVAVGVFIFLMGLAIVYKSFYYKVAQGTAPLFYTYLHNPKASAASM